MTVLMTDYLKRGKAKIAEYLRDLESIDINALGDMSQNPQKFIHEHSTLVRDIELAPLDIRQIK